MVGGKRASSTHDTKLAAMAWIVEREAAAKATQRGDILPQTVSELLTEYAERESPKHRGARWESVRLKKFARALDFADRRLDLVRREDIAAWRDGMRGKLADSSARREFGLLRAAFRVAVREWRWLAESPFDGIKPPPEGKPRTRRVADDEIERLLLALDYERGAVPVKASQYIAVAALLALETALRQGELLSLTRASIDAPARFLRLARTKNGDARDVPLSKAALALIAVCPGDPLFPVAPRTFDTLFRRARDRAALLDLHFHDLRREATTRLAAKLDVLQLAKMTGHRDVKVLLRTYYQPSMTDVAALLD